MIRPITLMADWDMRTEIVVNATAAWKPPAGTAPTDTAARDVLKRDIEAALQNPDRAQGVAIGREAPQGAQRDI